jgi:hypothetical protein
MCGQNNKKGPPVKMGPVEVKPAPERSKQLLKYTLFTSSSSKKHLTMEEESGNIWTMLRIHCKDPSKVKQQKEYNGFS